MRRFVMARKTGLGTVYQRGTRWVIDFYVSGKRIRETVKGAVSEKQARQKLRERIAQIQTKTFIRYEEKLGFENLVRLIENEYNLKQRRGVNTMRIHLKHLREFFRYHRAIDIQPEPVQRYQLHRKSQGAAPATINRETACLHHMLVLAVDMRKLSRVPKFEKLEGERIREGFLAWGEFDCILREINGRWRKNLIEFLFLTGWRSGKGKSLEWRQVFLNEQQPWIKAAPGAATKRTGQDLPLTGELLRIIREQAETRLLDCPYVFHNRGRKVGDLRKSWRSACRRAGLDGKLIHDFRRSAARNLTSLGVPQQVIMARCGWRTVSTFARYRIVDHADQIAANDAIDEARGRAVATVQTIKNG
jgi:integrase